MTQLGVASHSICKERDSKITKSLRKQAFRPRARLLELLGEQLIDNARLAVFEMVKNSYDADANKVVVCLIDPDKTEGSITVHDDGSGMTLETLTDIWLEPGADDRNEQKSAGIRSKKYKRLPLGEKGVGRFAAHKLGNEIKLWTRSIGSPEYYVEIDWSDQINRRYMDETEIHISESSGVYFKTRETGTHIEISGLKSLWTRGDVRRLWNNVTSITAPFITKDDFDVSLKVPGKEEWLKGVLEVGDIIASAIWTYEFKFDRNGYEWTYGFNPPSAINVKGETKKEVVSKLPFPKSLAATYYRDSEFSAKGEQKIPVVMPPSFEKGIGPVEGSLFVFDRDRDILPFLIRPTQVSKYLDDNGGIRVYRDDIRVYSYGEPGNDWLGLDLRRVNQPTKSISNNNILGILTLNISKSSGLHEKTSRDGFDNNRAYQRLKMITLSAISHLEGLRTVDKARMKRVLDKKVKESHISPSSAIRELRIYVEENDLDPQIGKIVDKIDKRIADMQDTLLRPGATQMHVATLFHEVDYGIRALNAAIRRGESPRKLQERSSALIELLDSFSNFFRKTPETILDMSKLVDTVLKINADRFKRHNVLVSFPIKTGEVDDFQIRAPKNIVMGALSNVIDNSIYWLDQKWSDNVSRKSRAIQISTSDYYAEGPALIIADNGPGYNLSPEDILQPFITLKPDGMGIGMYYSRLVMEALGGFVAFPDAKHVGLKKAYNGAVTAFVFPQGSWSR